MPDRPTFFTDRNLGKLVPAALSAAGARVETHDENFSDDMKDEDWIPIVANRNWVILTKDKRIRRRLRERQALFTSKARVFTLSSGNWCSADAAKVLTTHLEAMETLATALHPPFVVVVSRRGIEIVYPRTQQ
jgi:predicted nuclease of predicted toxin-antitoxin system